VIQALIFDCDGTLADTMPAHYQAWQEILRPLGIEFPLDRFYAMGGMPTDKIVVELCAGQPGGLPNGLDMDALVRDKALAFRTQDQRGAAHREGCRMWRAPTGARRPWPWPRAASAAWSR
jgi:beta-phosphoglucomutase-like phosphatase (HAD superfamily)